MRWYQSGNKYRNTKTIVDGIEFASRKEAGRYQELKILEQCGEIQDLQWQVKYILIPAQREPDVVGVRGGIKKGKVIEKEVAYIADFVYTQGEQTIVEDTKGFRTKEYIIKRKMMLYFYGIKIREI